MIFRRIGAGRLDQEIKARQNRYRRQNRRDDLGRAVGTPAADLAGFPVDKILIQLALVAEHRAP